MRCKNVGGSVIFKTTVLNEIKNNISNCVNKSQLWKQSIENMSTNFPKYIVECHNLIRLKLAYER